MSSAAQELRRRITTVTAAEKLVSALRLVAAARIRSSSHAALRTRPFAEELQAVLSRLIQHIITRQIHLPSIAHSAHIPNLHDLHGPVLADPLVQKALMDRLYLALLDSHTGPGSTLLTVVTADKKFCGSYNKEVLCRAVRRIRELEAAGKAVELVVVGRIARTFFEYHMPRLRIRTYVPIGRSPDAEQTATQLSHTLLSEFIAGGVERVEIVYTRFISLISSTPSARTLLPLTPTGLESVGDEIFQLVLTTRNGRLTAKRVPANVAMPDLSDMFYGISDDEAVLLLNSMLPMYVTSQVIRIVREAIASEQAARLAAMTAATDNARDLATGLRRKYHKERQARITNEIIEVVANV